MKDLLLIPNILTILRILLLGPAIYWLQSGHRVFAIICIIVLFLTDFLDGKLARALKQESYIGSILDPVADKIVVLGFFSYFFIQGEIPLFYFLLILVRDISQLLSIPILLIWKQIAFKVRPKPVAKWGTALNFILLAMVAAKLFISAQVYDSVLRSFFFYPTLIISSLIEVYILVTYLPRFLQIYRGSHDTFE